MERQMWMRKQFDILLAIVARHGPEKCYCRLEQRGRRGRASGQAPRVLLARTATVASR